MDSGGRKKGRKGEFSSRSQGRRQGITAPGKPGEGKGHHVLKNGRRRVIEQKALISKKGVHPLLEKRGGMAIWELGKGLRFGEKESSYEEGKREELPAGWLNFQISSPIGLFQKKLDAFKERGKHFLTRNRGGKKIYIPCDPKNSKMCPKKETSFSNTKSTKSFPIFGEDCPHREEVRESKDRSPLFLERVPSSLPFRNSGWIRKENYFSSWGKRRRTGGKKKKKKEKK